MRARWLAGSLALAAAWLTAAAAAQPKTTAADVFRLIDRNYSRIRDYRVDVELSADVHSPRMHISGSRATIYFKRPNKVKVVAREGFALMPDTFPGDPVAAIKSEFNAAYAGTAKIDGEPAHVLTLVPKTTQAQGRMKLFVEKRRGLILGTKLQAGDFELKSRWTYARIDGKYWLPSEIKLEMQVRARVPNPDPDVKDARPSAPGKGRAVVRFSNYKVNRGIPDSLFVKTKVTK